MSLHSRLIFLALSLLFAAVFVRLGFWQLDRLNQRRARNEVAAGARAQPTLDLNAPPTGAPRENRRIRVTGEYDRDHEIVLRGHLYREVPGVHIVTPLRIVGRDSAVLVNRGYLPSPDATYAVTDSLNEPGTVQVQGLALALPSSADSGGLLISNGKETWRRLDLAAVRRRLPYPVLDVYVLQAPDSALPLYPRRLEPLPLDNGPHLSYALQWFAFAGIALGGGSLLALRGKRGRG